MNDRALLIKALTQAADAELADYADKAAFSHRFSPGFEKTMAHLIARDRRISLYARRRIGKALLAAAIAVLVLLTGLMSVSASREKVLELIENVFSGGTQILLSEDSPPTPETIETVYTLAEVPKGYKLVDYYADESVVSEIYENDIGKQIIFDQYPSKSDLSFDNEHYYEKINLYGYPAYLYGDDDTRLLFWCNGEYFFNLSVPYETKGQLIPMSESIIVKK